MQTSVSGLNLIFRVVALTAWAVLIGVLGKRCIYWVYDCPGECSQHQMYFLGEVVYWSLLPLVLVPFWFGFVKPYRLWLSARQ